MHNTETKFWEILPKRIGALKYKKEIGLPILVPALLGYTGKTTKDT